MSVDALTRYERETTVNVTAADDLVTIDTTIPNHITRLRADEAFTEVASGFHGTTEWARFVVPADRWTPVGVRRTRKLSAAQLSNLTPSTERLEVSA